VHGNLGNALKDQGRLEEAVVQYRLVLALRPEDAEIANQIGVCCRILGNDEEAEAYYRKAVELDPPCVAAFRNLGWMLKDQGRVAEAAAQFERAFAVQPDDGLRILKATLLPVIPESMDHLLNARRAYERQLSELLGQDLMLKDPSVEVGATNFYLAYQGCNDRDLQQTIARLYEKACPALAYVAPRFRSRRPAAAGGKIEVGFLSKFFLSHTIGRLTRGFIAQLDRKRFSVSVFLFPQKPDQISEFIVRHADRTIVLPAALPAARELIARENLDVLFYPDIGMDPFTYFLAFSRLAPVQCVSWGHPDTTGIPAIDYFVSSAHLEPEGADLHYTERLVRLAQMPTYYYRPDVPPGLKTRSDFNLDEERVIYLCPQSLFKLHPDFDEFVAGVLRAHPKGQAVFIDGNFKSFTELIMRRFRNTIPDVRDRIRVLPRQNSRDFISLLSVVDVILDPVKWSGGSTTYEALSVGAPVVTMPSEYMRGRVTYGCYKQMGVMDCVASSREEYVALAVRLGTDPTYRAEVKAKILAANAVLYENGKAVRELERFFEKAVGNARCATVEGS
jgi:predicted O-linked N-acetylglucosamine transferase (SPINDLY family)